MVSHPNVSDAEPPFDYDRWMPTWVRGRMNGMLREYMTNRLHGGQTLVSRETEFVSFKLVLLVYFGGYVALKLTCICVALFRSLVCDKRRISND
jgi:hypothetical protein